MTRMMTAVPRISCVEFFASVQLYASTSFCDWERRVGPRTIYCWEQILKQIGETEELSARKDGYNCHMASIKFINILIEAYLSTSYVETYILVHMFHTSQSAGRLFISDPSSSAIKVGFFEQNIFKYTGDCLDNTEKHLAEGLSSEKSLKSKDNDRRNISRTPTFQSRDMGSEYT